MRKNPSPISINSPRENNHLAAACQLPPSVAQHRRRAVVHHNRRFRAGQHARISHEVWTSRFPRAPAAQRRTSRLEYCRRSLPEKLFPGWLPQGGARPRFVVQDHTGGIDHSAQRWRKHLLDTPYDTELQRFPTARLASSCGSARNNVPAAIGPEHRETISTRKPAFQTSCPDPPTARPQEQFIHGRQPPQPAPSGPWPESGFCFFFPPCRHWSNSRESPRNCPTVSSGQPYALPAVVSCAGRGAPLALTSAKTESRMKLSRISISWPPLTRISRHSSATFGQLKIEYDMYSVAAAKRPPTEIEMAH